MIIEQIEKALKEAQKCKDEVVVSALRNLKSEAKNTEIAKGHELSDEEFLAVVVKKVKQHKDSIESFKAGNRDDLAGFEQKQMAVLQAYLPQQLSEDEVRVIVKQVITDLSATASDFGKVMKETLLRSKGQTDGSMVSKIVKEQLK